MTGTAAPRDASWRIPRLDLVTGATVALVAAVVTCVLYWQLSFTITHLDVWFDSDSLYVYEQITNRASPHNDTNARHPIFVLVFYPLVFLQSRLLPLDKPLAALIVLVGCSTLAVTAMYAALRLLDRPVRIALTFTGIFLASSCGMLFLGIYERLIPGGLSVLLCIIAFCLYERRLMPATVLVLAAALTLGITITNFGVGIVTLLLALGLRRGLQGAINAFVLVLVLNLVVEFTFPASKELLDFRSWPLESSAFSSNQERLEKAGTLADKASAFWAHSIVMPHPAIVNKPAPWSQTRYLSMQKAGLTRDTPGGYLALAFWTVLLGYGFARSFGRASRTRADPFIAALVLAQCALFLVFGSETVLYSPYYVPLMLIVASKAWTAHGADRRLLVVSVAFLAVLLWNNLTLLAESIRMATSLI